MAKIVFYSNPLDPTEKKEIEHNGTIQGALEKLGIENRPLALVTNGENPDEVDTSTILATDDVVEIHTPVHGSKGDWATILSVASIAALFIPGYGTALALGLGLAAGALKAEHEKDLAQNATASARGVGTGASAPSTATNQARPLGVVPVILGSIRFAPDVYTDVVTGRPMATAPIWQPDPTGYGFQFNTWELSPVDGQYSYTEYRKLMLPFRKAFSVQTFCFGFGDLSITGRMVGGSQLTGLQGLDSYRVEVASTQDSFGAYGGDPLASFFYLGVDNNAIPLAPPSVKRFPDVQLFNHNSPTTTIPGTNTNQLNWIIFEGGRGHDSFRFAIKGILTNPNFANAITPIELQYRVSGDTTWTTPDLRVRVLDSSESGEVYTVFDLPASDLKVSVGIEERIQVRIRKMWLDTDDNDSGTSSTLSITDAFSYPSTGQVTNNNDVIGKHMFPMHVEALYLSNSFASPTANKNYSALVDSFCWVARPHGPGYIWEWIYNDNPAWAFYYFARGGYRNLESRRTGKPASVTFSSLSEIASEAPKYSPTDYWQNYKTAEGNEELVFGGGYENNEIDILKIYEWARFCEDEGLTIGVAMRDNFSLLDALEQIATVGRASVSYDTGKLSVVWESKDQVPTTMFGMANIIAGSFAANYRSNINLRRVKAKFSNKDDDYNTDTVEAVVPFSDPASIEATEVTLVGVTDPAVAQREVNLIAARQFFQTRSYSWKTDQEGFLARRGDLVYLSHDSTQFGYSGRVVNFIFDDSDNVIGLRGSSLIDSEVSWIMVRLPNSEMIKLECHFSDGIIYFDEEFPIADAPYHIRDQRRKSKNLKSRFPRTTADDYIYIADIKETVGKIVRISTVETDENHNFTYTAVDEDPAMWAFENGVDIDSGSINDAIGIIEVYDCSVSYLGEGVVELNFNASDDALFMFVNQTTEQPIEVNGRFSTSEKTVRLELDEGVPVVVKIVPLSVTEKVQSRSLEVELWQA